MPTAVQAQGSALALFQRRISQKLIRAACAFFITGLSACSTAPPTPSVSAPTPSTPAKGPELSEEERWQQRVAEIASMSTWRVRGKVAYRLPDDAGSASLDWRQSGEESRLRLSGPMGVGSTEIANEGALLSVKRDGIERLYPADAAPWLSNGALLPVPVASIQHWLRGVPDPALPVMSLEMDRARAKGFEQNGWVIDYSEYQEQQGIAMPRRLSLAAPNSELTLRIILRDWEL